MELRAFLDENYDKYDYIAKMYINNPEHGSYTYHFKTENFDSSSEINCYMSMNPMCFVNRSINRDKQHVSKLKWLYVDLDTYNTEYTKQQILYNLEENYFNKLIPTPTYVVDSGRGMYLLWRINEHIKAAPRWEKVQNFLYENLKEFGADGSVVTDTSRVLRTIGSINSKTNTRVEILRKYNNYIYTLYEIAKEYIPSKVIEMPIKASKTENKELKNKSRIILMNTKNTVLISRLKDLETLLLKYRDKENGHRQNILFLYRYWSLCLTEDKEDALNRVLLLNSKLKHSLSEKEVIKATASAETYYNKNKSFRMRNNTILKFLEIKDEEMKSLRTMISVAERIERKRNRNKQAYLRLLFEQGKNTKQDNIKMRLKAIYSLLEQNKTQIEICKELNISRATFYNDKKKLSQLTPEELREIIEIECESEQYESQIEHIENSTGSLCHVKKSKNLSPCIKEKKYVVHSSSLAGQTNMLNTAPLRFSG